MNASHPASSVPAARWILFTWYGWLIGIALVIGFSTLMESTGLSSGSQFGVGVGMAAGIGMMQGYAARRRLGTPWRWMGASVSGFTISFVVADLVIRYADLPPEGVLPYATGAGALLAGWLQARQVVHPSSTEARAWVLVSTVAWLAAHGLTIMLVALGNTVKLHAPGWLTIVYAFSSILVGGPVLGAISFPVARRMLAPPEQA